MINELSVGSTLGREAPVMLALRLMGLRPGTIEGRRGLARGLAPMVCAERVRSSRLPSAFAFPARCARMAMAKASASSLDMVPAVGATDGEEMLTTGVVDEAVAAEETSDCADKLPWLTTLLLLLPAEERNGLFHIRMVDAGAETDFVKGAGELCVEVATEAVTVGDRIGAAAVRFGLDCTCALAPECDEAMEPPDGTDEEATKN